MSVEDGLNRINEALKSDKFTIDPTLMASKEYVKNEVAQAQLNDKEVDLSGYATKEDIKNMVSINPDTGKSDKAMDFNVGALKVDSAEVFKEIIINKADFDKISSKDPHTKYLVVE